jgi:IclR family mhp operon transcriptional activator
MELVHVMDARQEVKSIKKALRVLTFLNAKGDSTVTEVARAIEVPRTTAYRLLETLASELYVEKQPHSDIYRLTSRVQTLSAGFGEEDLVIEVAKPLIAAFGATMQLPTALATPRGRDMVVRIATDFDAPIVIDRFVVGFTIPILRAPTGFCYLAHCDQFTKERIFTLSREQGIDAIQNGLDIDRFDYLLDRIRAEGFCDVRFREFREGGVAIPLVISDRVFGGIVMRYLKSAVKPQHVEREFAPRLRALGKDISEAFKARIRTEDALRRGDMSWPLGNAYAIA